MLKRDTDVLDSTGGMTEQATFNWCSLFLQQRKHLGCSRRNFCWQRQPFMSSKSGGRLSEALGANLTISPEKVKKSLKIQVFALCLHKLPFINAICRPCKKRYRNQIFLMFAQDLFKPCFCKLAGNSVYSEALVEPIARVFANLGIKRGYVFYGTDGMDEVTVTAPTKVCEINNGKFSS